MRQSIVAHSAGKRYRRYGAPRPQTAKEAVLGWRNWFRKSEVFWGLRDVSFSVPAGCTLGVIGRNGAGKSTLLNLLGGVSRCDEGRIEVRGQINALLDLGSGFHPDLTGRENVYVAGVIAGLNRREIAARFASIVEFAELEQFIDSPLRTYSDGMRMRLAFSVATHTEPDVLLVDEVLAVGDAAFQDRCLERIRQIKSRGATIVVVSHSIGTVREFCDQALLLDGGRLLAAGPAELVVERYLHDVEAAARLARPALRLGDEESGKLESGENRFGSLEAEITDVHLSSAGIPTVMIAAGEPLQVQIAYVVHQPRLRGVFGVSIADSKGEIVLDLNGDDTASFGAEASGAGAISLLIERLDLAAGEYYVNVGIYSRDWQTTYDFHWRRYPLAVTSGAAGYGKLCPPHRWLVSAPTGAER